jgi:alkyldihydroxyacetonephosphate synthase
VSASPPLHVSPGEDLDYSRLAQKIQKAHQKGTIVSTFHIQNISKVLQLDKKTVQEALEAVGCKLWPPSHHLSQELDIAVSPMQQWLSLLHVSHLLAPCIAETHPMWSHWLDQVDGGRSPHLFQDSHSVRKLVDPVLRVFDYLDSAVEDTMNALRDRGFEHPSIDHVSTITSRREPTLLPHLIRAAASFRIPINVPEVKSRGALAAAYEVQNLSDTEETLGFWGFADSGFVLCKSRERVLQVVMKGSRYDICGQPLPKLVPFIENEIGVRIEPLDAPSCVHVNLSTLSSDLTENDLDHLQQATPKVSTESVDLARHGAGHSQEDIYLLRFGGIDAIRLPDAVAWPSSEEEVVAIVGLAKTRKWCLIPHGGGTNVSNATRCPDGEVEPRPIISVDMKLMKRILWLNEEDGVAHVEAGITGLELVEELGRRGYTIGHEPDSLEFSTLGGWIATKASGMKQNKYGNIEDIVKSVRVVGSEGVFWKGVDSDNCHSFGREARGIDLCSLMLGSEGCYGIITSAVVRVWPKPECRHFDSVILPDFGHGIRFMRELASLEPNLPASVRLLDNEQFRLGHALQTEASGLLAFINALKRFVMSSLRSYSPDCVVCATIAFEGTYDEVRSQRRHLKKAAAAHGGTLAGSKIGRAGYQLTFAIAYLRDFAMTYSFLGESFETFAPWSKLQSIVDATKKTIRCEHERRCLPGRPFIGCRITQLYHEGACLYFYFCMSVRGIRNPSTVFSQLEHAARNEILAMGGSLSHHHGIGKKRADFAKEMDSVSFRESVKAFKEAMDPSNIFGARNGGIG